MFAPIPKLKDIALINNPMLTGTTMVDALAPIGKGQNMLVIGHDLPHMRGFVRDFFATQIKDGRNTKCIYGVTQHRDQAIEELRIAGLLDDVIVVSTRRQEGGGDDEASKSAEGVAIAATACAIGETFAFQGMNALVVIDTMDQLKEFWDATTRVLVDAYGVDAVVKSDREGGASSEMRGFFSSLIQRSSQYNTRLGGGSVTLTLLTPIPSSKAADDESKLYAVEDFIQCSDKIKTRLDMLVKKNIPLTPANLRKIQIPIPSVSEGQRRLVLQHVDDLMSMSDGQIWLDEVLEEQGQRPPLDPQKSVTRIGIGADTESRADAPAIRKVVEGLRLDLSQAASMDGADITTKAAKKQVLKRHAWLLAMHQEAGEGGRSLSESCTALLAATNGHLDDTIEKGGLAGTALGKTVLSNLLQHVQETAFDATTEIDQTLDMSSQARDAIEKAIESYFALP
jgi:F-type H+-transporting ATPase subunit alpha